MGYSKLFTDMVHNLKKQLGNIWTNVQSFLLTHTCHTSQLIEILQL